MPAAEATPTQVIRTRMPPRTRRTPVGAGIATPQRLRKLAPLWIALVIALLLATLISYLATRPTTAVIPSLQGLTLAKAIERVEAVGLKLDPRADVTRVDSTQPKDIVLAITSGKPDTMVPLGSHVKVRVSTGIRPCCTMPSVVGLSEADARKTIEGAGLVVGTVTRKFDKADAGTVLEQSPLALRTLERGDKVSIVVSAGEEKGKGKGRGGDD